MQIGPCLNRQLNEFSTEMKGKMVKKKALSNFGVQLPDHYQGRPNNYSLGDIHWICKVFIS